MRYVAFIHCDEEAGFGISFPDFPSCKRRTAKAGKALRHRLRQIGPLHRRRGLTGHSVEPAMPPPTPQTPPARFLSGD